MAPELSHSGFETIPGPQASVVKDHEECLIMKQFAIFPHGETSLQVESDIQERVQFLSGEFKSGDEITASKCVCFHNYPSFFPTLNGQRFAHHFTIDLPEEFVTALVL
jgi:hypothetical protein